MPEPLLESLPWCQRPTPGVACGAKGRELARTSHPSQSLDAADDDARSFAQSLASVSSEWQVVDEKLERFVLLAEDVEDMSDRTLPYTPDGRCAANLEKAMQQWFPDEHRDKDLAKIVAGDACLNLWECCDLL